MKLLEVISKHPILTFLVIDEIVVGIENCVAMITNTRGYGNTKYGIFSQTIKDADDKLKEKINAKKEAETEPEVEEETEE